MKLEWTKQTNNQRRWYRLIRSIDQIIDKPFFSDDVMRELAAIFDFCLPKSRIRSTVSRASHAIRLALVFKAIARTCCAKVSMRILSHSPAAKRTWSSNRSFSWVKGNNFHIFECAVLFLCQVESRRSWRHCEIFSAICVRLRFVLLVAQCAQRVTVEWKSDGAA